MLREYAALRVQGAAAIMSPEGMAKSAALHDRLWAATATVDKKTDPVMVGLFIQSLNETIDLDAVRVAALRNQIPDIIWYSLYIITMLTMAEMGYQFGLSGIRSWMSQFCWRSSCGGDSVDRGSGSTAARTVAGQPTSPDRLAQ